MVLLLGLSGCTPTLTPSNKTSDPTKQPNIPLTPNSPLPFTPDPNLTSLAQIIATQNVVSVTPAEPAEITLATPTIVVTATPNAQNTPMPVTPLPALATFAQNLPTTFQARLLNQLEMGRAGSVLSLAMSPNGQLLAVGSKNQIWLWESATGKIVQTVYTNATNSDEKGAASLNWSPDGKQLAAGGLHGTVTLWQLSQPTNRLRNGPFRLEPDPDAATFGDEVTVAFSPDSRLLAAVDSKGTIVAWDSQTLALKMLFDTSYAGHIAWAADSQSLTDEFLGLGYLNDVQLYGPTEAADVNSSQPYNVAWSPNGKTIALSSQDFDLMLAAAPEAHTKGGVTKLSGAIPTNKNTEPLRPLAWSADSQLIALGNVPIAGKVSIIRTDTLKNVLTIEAGNQSLTGLQWAANSLLITGGMDGAVKFWQLK